MPKVMSGAPQPVVRLPGVIVGSHIAVFLGALVVYCVSASDEVLAFAIVALANTALTYIEQAAALRLFSSQTGGYIMNFDLVGNTSISATDPMKSGVSPTKARLWELPSVTAQLLSMTAAYWTMATIDRAAAERRRDPAGGSQSVYLRTLGIWSAAGIILAYTAANSYATALQIGAGVAFGTAIGVGGYEMSSSAAGG